ncbi:S41 family peptidase [Chryseobacterium sp. JUb7]|uniref:S41 family peptidase n=1 Tax=Chryseobacterium sp. JUb7 TaxID=2940599 RepID=UPI00216A5B17|nr:S41 family peptidase [Chryseobacterium sp. JUb7]MCS3530406.1 hypothetical protein [Chryseobacterium sp. JUb7]
MGHRFGGRPFNILSESHELNIDIEMILRNKGKSILILFSILGMSVHLNAQKAKTSQDSINVFYNQLFFNLKKAYLLRKSVDWKSVESDTKENLKKYNSFKNSLDEIKVLFGKIDATHCTVFKGNKRYSLAANIPLGDQFSEQWKRKNSTKPGFEVKVIDGKYGYILMPKIAYIDQTPENTHKIAQPLYDQITELKAKNKLEGWIVDLRFNTGGNSEPMLLALYDFLGNNVVWGSLDVNKKPTDKMKLSNGTYIYNSKKLSYINPKGELLDNAKVSVITGLMTASSGEITALAFRGRPNTLLIGETTLGYTTGNMQVKLPFDFDMALTSSYNSDRNGIYYERIVPDISVSKGDNFDDLLLDKNIQKAIKFFQKPN